MINKFNYVSVEIDSRNCVKNSIFVCINNDYINNLNYVNDAILNGASLIVTNTKIESSVDILFVDNVMAIFEELLNFYYPYKSKLIGITGTDGKTSTCLMIKSLIDQNNECGYIGTNGVMYSDKKYKTKNTTPDIVTVRKHLFNMSNENITYVAMECSSEGIYSNRLISLKFDVLVYTNITHEHLNTHKTMKNYINTKLSLRQQLKSDGIIFVNGDDNNLKIIRQQNTITYGFKNNNCNASIIETKLNTTTFKYEYENTKNVITIPFFGKYNVYNCLASILVSEHFGLLEKTNFNFMHQISGRFELLKNNEKEVVIDFAHTPNALEQLLKNIKNITKKKIILVMGSAGGKDKTKRPLLGRVANKYADEIIITSEDPKNELITNIFSDIISTIKKEYYLVLFRKDAIKMGIELLNKNSILVIVGKGLENHEQIYNIKFNHNDYQYTKKLLNS